MTFTIKVNKNEIIYFKAFLFSLPNIIVEDTTNPYEAFRAKYNGGVIIGYSSGSIVINDDTLKPIAENILSEIRMHKLIFDVMIGSDETGKGELIGPLVVSSVALNPKQTIYLQNQGIKDSKIININEIYNLSEVIKMNCLSYKIISVYPEEFNLIMNDYKKIGKNLNHLLAKIHFEVINSILNKYSTNKKIIIVIDEFDKLKMEDEMKNIIKRKNITVIQKPKAEEETAVAAASILAKNEREKIITELSHKYNINLKNIDISTLRNSSISNKILKLNYIK